MKKIKLCILLTCCFLILGMTSNNKTYAQENTIPLNDDWITDNVTDDVRFYTFTIPSAGTVTYTFQSYSDGGSLCLKNEDLSTTYSRINCDGTPSNPISEAQTNILEQGTYVLKVCRSSITDLEWEWTGNYRLKVSFTPANNNEAEPNDTFETAMELNGNQQILGLLSDCESEDYFKITLDSPQKIHIIYRFDTPFIFSLFDGNFLPIVEGSPYVPSSGTEEWTGHLETGTYYINISKYSKYGSGIYTLNWFTETPISSIELKETTLTLKKGTSYDLLANVQPNNATNKELKWTSSNSTVASVNASGKVTANKVGASIITATSQDGSDISTSCIIIVKPQKTKITKLNYNSSDARKINVQLRKQDGVSGYQIAYSTDKNFKNKSTYISKSTSTVTRKLAKNKKYYFKARAYYTYKNTRYYGAWSDVKTVTIKRN